MEFTNNKTWYIPRASLSSNSSHSGKSNRSTDSIKTYDPKCDVFGKKNANSQSHGTSGRREIGNCDATIYSLTGNSTMNSTNTKSRKDDQKKSIETNLDKIEQFEESVVPKRGSRSSQGSTDSNNSTHSASSLLLSVANLENFTKQQTKQPPTSAYLSHDWQKDTSIAIDGTDSQIGDRNKHLLLNMTTINANREKSKDFDQLSIASSTHFTVVNGFGRANINRKSNSICRDGRQITILIVTMSMFFMAGIIGAIFFMEMRARDMPMYHQ